MFTLALAASVEAQTSRRDKLPNIGIDNFGHVNDNYLEAVDDLTEARCVRPVPDRVSDLACSRCC